MNDVMDDEAAEGGNPRHREYLLTAALQRPQRLVLRVGLVHPRSRLPARVVEGSEDLGARGFFGESRRSPCQIE